MANRKKHTGKRTTLPWAAVMAVLLFPTVILGILNVSPPKTGVPVIGVIDGDTFVLEGKTRVRLRNVDAPELEFCGGEEAKKMLERLVAGKQVRLEELIPDQYGRGMALVYTGDTLVNREMLAGGYVRYHHDISSKEEELKAARDGAKALNKGIYRRCQSKENTQNPNCYIKGNIDPQTGAKKYYLPGCAQYAFTVVEQDIGENWFCTEKEAQHAGYTKAKTCAER